MATGGEPLVARVSLDVRALGIAIVLAALPAHADRVAQNASCAGCHPDIAAEWTRSLHRNAWNDRVFAKSYVIEPLAFCRGCHAPESDPAREPTKAAQAVGVSCTTCHDDDRGVHATHASPNAQHAIVVDATLATPRACAKCHEFDFPAGANQVSPQPMQDTVAEHARGDRATTPCQSCHMPVVEGGDGEHRSHAFAVLADPALLRSAVAISAAQHGDGVRVTLRADHVGHAFPTGDMFRRLEVRAQRVDQGRVLASARPVVLARRFEDRARDPDSKELTFMRVEAEDTRVPPPGEGARVVDLALPQGASQLQSEIVWSVVYQRMSTPMADAFGVSQVLDEIELARGTVPSSRLALNTGGSR